MPGTGMQGTVEIGFDKAAWELAVHFDLRPELIFDNFPVYKPAEKTSKGSVANFTWVEDMTVNTTPLDEYTDSTPKWVTDTNTQIVVDEYGDAVKTTRFLRETSFVPFNPVVAETIGWNAGVTQDTLARAAFHTGTNVQYGGDATAKNTIDNTDLLTPAQMRRVRAKLLRQSVPTFDGFYVATLHPDASVDFRESTGSGGWRLPQEYGAMLNGGLLNGEVGIFEGIRYIEAARALKEDGAGADTTPGDATAGPNYHDVYHTLVFGKQAFAKAGTPGIGPTPEVSPGPVTDIHKRFIPMGWYWIGGYDIFRQECVERIEYGSSLDEG